jgi:hypothetical protein
MRLLQIASSFTSKPIAQTLRPAVVEAAIADDFGLTQYAQVAEYMLGSAIDSEDIVGTLVLVRVEDWLREDVKSPSFDAANFAEQARQKLRARIDEFVNQLAALARHGKPVWFLACPSSGWIADKYKLEGLCRTQTNLLTARARNLPQVTILNWPTSWPADANDRGADRLGQIPFTPEAFHQLGEFVGRQLARTFVRNVATDQSSLSEGSPELAAYLAGLRVRVRLTPVDASDRPHVDRLLRTAAAFSLTGERPDISDAEVDAFLAPGRSLLVAVSDRLSDYGPSGVVASHKDGDSVDIDALALSCPVMGKQVEYGLLSALAQIAIRERFPKLIFEYRSSGRNQTMLSFLRSIADAQSDTRYVLPVDLAEPRIQKATIAPGSWSIELPTYLPPSNRQ